METSVTDDFSCIRIQVGNNVLLVHKWQIKTIDTIMNDSVRIDIGEGALRHIYISAKDVINPAVANGFELREALKVMLDSPYDLQNLLIQQQYNCFVALNDILAAINDLVITLKNGGGSKQPSRVDETVPQITYYGYSAPGTQPTSQVWSILRATRTNGIIIYEWPNGKEEYHYSWEERYQLNYLPLI